MSDHEQYSMGPASAVQVSRPWSAHVDALDRHLSGNTWAMAAISVVLIAYPIARTRAGKSVAGADRPGATARVGSFRDRCQPGCDWNGAADLGWKSPADCNQSHASRSSEGARVWRYALGTRGLRRRHAPDAVGQDRSPLHLDGCCRVAHFFRCAGVPPQRNSPRPHRWRRCHEVRRLAAAERRVRPAVRCQSAQLAAAGGSKIVIEGDRKA